MTRKYWSFTSATRPWITWNAPSMTMIVPAKAIHPTHIETPRDVDLDFAVEPTSVRPTACSVIASSLRSTGLASIALRLVQ